jgi:hypothetical protein
MRVTLQAVPQIPQRAFGFRPRWETAGFHRGGIALHPSRFFLRRLALFLLYAVLLPPTHKYSRASPGGAGYGVFDDYDLGNRNQFFAKRRWERALGYSQ